MSDNERKPFGWGESVVVMEEAPDEYAPKERGWVVGFSLVEDPEFASKHGVSPGDWVCFVEFAERPDRHIPARFLKGGDEE
jgi:hypothetical protein